MQDQKNRVVVRILGGLGNQMFQYASAYAIARARNAQLFIDPHDYKKGRERAYLLDIFEIDQTIIPFRYNKKPKNPLKWLTETEWKRYQVLEECGHHYDEALITRPADYAVLAGYMQSPLYFQHMDAEIRALFRVKRGLSEKAKAAHAAIAASPCPISIHVRRGDYLSNPSAAKVHNVLPLDYYKRAIELMQRLHGDGIQYFIFSEEQDVLREEFDFLPNASFIGGEPEAPWEDMMLMSACRHHIIANSSFSWWGAWLNPDAQKDVIAPAQWFTRDKLASCNVVDLYPDTWMILK